MLYISAFRGEKETEFTIITDANGTREKTKQVLAELVYATQKVLGAVAAKSGISLDDIRDTFIESLFVEID